jgi:hypothetical protein
MSFLFSVAGAALISSLLCDAPPHRQKLTFVFLQEKSVSTHQWKPPISKRQRKHPPSQIQLLHFCAVACLPYLFLALKPVEFFLLVFPFRLVVSTAFSCKKYLSFCNHSECKMTYKTIMQNIANIFKGKSRETFLATVFWSK